MRQLHVKPRSPWFTPQVLQDVFYFPATECVFSSVPKNGCTTVKASLLQAEGIPFTTTSIHKVAEPFRLRSVYVHDSTRSIIVLRDPVERAVSAYVDKIVMLAEHWARDLVNSTLQGTGLVDSPVAKLSFREFVQFLMLVPNDALDRHFRPQVDFWIFEQYDQVAVMGTSNSIEEALEAVGVRMFGVAKHSRMRYDQMSVRASDLGPDTPAWTWRDLLLERTSVPSADLLVTEDIRALLEARYRDDIELIDALPDSGPCNEGGT